MRALIPLLAIVISLAACGGEQDRAENVADSLEEAAEVSDDAADEILENAADRLREDEYAQPPGEVAQDALQRAGEAQADTVTVPAEGQNIPSPAGAAPHAAGDPVPPPQTRSAPPEGRR